MFFFQIPTAYSSLSWCCILLVNILYFISITDLRGHLSCTFQKIVTLHGPFYFYVLNGLVNFFNSVRRTENIFNKNTRAGCTDVVMNLSLNNVVQPVFLVVHCSIVSEKKVHNKCHGYFATCFVIV